MTGILTRSHFYFTTEITHNSKSTPLITSHQIVQVNNLEEPAHAPLDDFVFNQTDTCYVNIIPDTWIRLDSQSTVSVFKNKLLLSNIRPSPTNLRIHTNGGTQISSLLGTVKKFGDVWYNTDSVSKNPQVNDEGCYRRRTQNSKPVPGQRWRI
jgi:hypothetical protein